MNKVLITGVSGFSGRHLSTFLRSYNHLELVGIDKKPNDNVRTHTCDLNEPGCLEQVLALEKPDYIINLAGKIKTGNFREYYEANVFTGIQLLDAIIKNDLKKSTILFISSAAVYGIPKDINISEQSPLRPVNFYGTSKVAMETVCRQYIRNYGLDIRIARPFNLLGKNLSPSLVIASFAGQLLEIKHQLRPPVIHVGNLESERDFIDIEDLVRAYWMILQNGKPGETYNIASGVPVQIRNVLDEMISLLKLDIEIRVDASRIQKHDVPKQIGNNDKLKQLGWRPEIPLTESLKRMLGIG